MARSRSSNIRYNPRTGEFEGIDANPPPRRSAAGAEVPPSCQATQLNNEVSTLSGDLIGRKLVKMIKGKKGEVSISNKKRWKFVVLGLLFGFLGLHLLYAKRWFLFLLLWAGLITGGAMSKGDKKAADEPNGTPAAQVAQEDKSEKDGDSPVSNIGFGVWALLWIGGTLFIKKDGKGNRM